MASAPNGKHHSNLTEDLAAFELDNLTAARHDDAKAAQVRARTAQATTPQQMKAAARTIEVQRMVKAQARDRASRFAQLKAQRLARDSKA